MEEETDKPAELTAALPASEMTNEDAEFPSEIYAAYGLAMHYGQRLEFTLVKLILMNSAAAGETYDELRRAVAEMFNKKTMGFLRDQFLRTGIDRTSVESISKAALERRNFLAHRYFRERPLRTRDGYEVMLEELADASELFQETKTRLDTLSMEIFKAQGISLADLLDQQKARVRTEDWHLVGNGSVARIQVARERDQETIRSFVLPIEWEKATEDERANLLRLADMLP